MKTTRLNCSLLTSEYYKLKAIAATKRISIADLVRRWTQREIRLFDRREREKKEEKQTNTNA